MVKWVSGVLAVGMMGIFLPLTIYFQSALGFSALKAGLTLAPSSLVMIFVAPFLGKLTDKTGGKYILICGLTLFAVGMGWVVLIATPHSTWYDFLPALIVFATILLSLVNPWTGAAAGIALTGLYPLLLAKVFVGRRRAGWGRPSSRRPSASSAS